jgi:hypothetical protein
LKKTHHKKGLVEWLKVKALSSNPSTAKKKKKKEKMRSWWSQGPYEKRRDTETETPV